MTGLYPDAPDNRMAWDRDGSILVTITDTGSISQHSTATMEGVNSEDANYLQWWGGSSAGSGHRYLALLFPQLRDVDSVFSSQTFDDVSPQNLQWSADTTTGSDGTWTSIGSYPRTTSTSKTAMRDNITTVSLTGVKGLRWYCTKPNSASFHARIYSWHIFGEHSSTPDALQLWDPSVDQRLPPAHLDYGDVPRDSTLDKTFRVKNSSSTQTAQSVSLMMEALHDTSPTNVSQFSFSDDGLNFESSLNIGDLSAGAISGVITLRRTTSSTASLGLWWTRVIAAAASWA